MRPASCSPLTDDMNRLQKKCALASVVLHGLLVLVTIFGAAFQKKPAPIPYQRINVVPSWLVDSALSGGGNPNLARTDERVKGNTLTPQPLTSVTPPAPKPPEPQPRPAPPAPAPIPPRPEARKIEPRPEPRPEPVKKPASKPADLPKPTSTAKAPVPPKPQLELVPTVRNDNTKAREKAEAAERETRKAAQQDANFRRELASKVAQTTTSGLKAGFEGGTKVDVGGPGGKAYANYALFVREAYDNAWQVMPDLASQDYAVSIEVTVSRTGRVVSHRIVNRSGNSGMDRSVQRALDRIKASGLPKFPEDAPDSERTFSIEFNLKAKRLVG